jgi:3-isopropylmalate/(R)-2-methylmalate dehydratase small subunit
MDKFTTHLGVAVPLIQSNIDTDVIIPSREMKLVSKKGLGEGLFSGWRYTKPGSRELKTEFILNQAEYLNTSIILSGLNFGCGSSREHAVWALAEYGIRAVIAPSFGAIFYNNCVRNGVLPVVVNEEIITELARFVEANPQQNRIQLDLNKQRISTNNGASYQFDIPAAEKDMLLNGLDAIALTMLAKKEIDSFEQKDKKIRNWAYLDIA